MKYYSIVIAGVKAIYPVIWVYVFKMWCFEIRPRLINTIVLIIQDWHLTKCDFHEDMVPNVQIIQEIPHKIYI